MYHSLRRSYRSACKDFAKNGASIQTSSLCLSSLRNFTGKWDCGTGKPAIGIWSQMQSKKINGKIRYTLFVSLSLQRWLKSN